MATFSKIALIVLTFFWLTFCSEIPTIGHASSSGGIVGNAPPPVIFVPAHRKSRLRDLRVKSSVLE